MSARVVTAEKPSSPTGVSPPPAEQTIAAFYQEHAELPRDGSGPWIELIGKAGGPEELRKLFAQVVADRFTVEATVHALIALAEAATRSARPSASERANQQPLSDPDYEALTRLLFSPDLRVQAAAARLAGTWKMEYSADRLGELAASEDARVRVAAFEALRAMGGKTALTFLAALTRPYQRSEMRRRALVAIAEISLEGAVMKAPEALPLIDNEADALETWQGLLKVERAASSFAVRLPKGLPAPVLAAGLRAARELGEAGEPLVKALAKEAESGDAANERRK